MARRSRVEKGPGGRGLTSSGSGSPAGILLFFIDGVGIAPADPSHNPLAAARLPTFERLLAGARPVLEDVGAAGVATAAAHLIAIDATLQVDGRPQSGTGQTALLTGVNAPALLGRHFGPWVPTALREMLATESIFEKGRGAGLQMRFANAYPRGYMDKGGRGARRPGAFPLAASGASLLHHSEIDVRARRALVSSITTDSWRRYVDADAPMITAAEGGAILAGLLRHNDLTVFAHYDTDFAGHRRDLREGVAAIERVDAFLSGLLSSLPDDVLVVMTSDHGNLEDARTGHTRNGVPLLAIGPGAREFVESVQAITDVAPTILRFLGTR